MVTQKRGVPIIKSRLRQGTYLERVAFADLGVKIPNGLFINGQLLEIGSMDSYWQLGHVQ